MQNGQRTIVGSSSSSGLNITAPILFHDGTPNVSMLAIATIVNERTEICLYHYSDQWMLRQGHRLILRTPHRYL
jgi:hypothetical protein